MFNSSLLIVLLLRLDLFYLSSLFSWCPIYVRTSTMWPTLLQSGLLLRETIPISSIPAHLIEERVKGDGSSVCGATTSF